MTGFRNGEVNEGPPEDFAGEAHAQVSTPTPTSGRAVTDHAPAQPEASLPDHGPLGATLSDRTLAKVLSRPAHVPSLVALDEAHSAAGVINAAMRWEETENGAPWDHAEAEMALRKAVIDYRATVS